MNDLDMNASESASVLQMGVLLFYMTDEQN